MIRIVEAQHRIATNRLVGNTVKPELPETARRLPWLVASPFRYG